MRFGFFAVSVRAVWFATALLCAAVAPASAQETTKAHSAKSGKKEKKAAAPAEGIFSWQRHPSLQFGDIAKIELRARVAGDDRRSGILLPDGEPATDTDTRHRVAVSGTVVKVAAFQIERDLGERVWRDVFANYRQFDHVELQAGQFKVPFGLDLNTNSSNLDFVYRSRAASELSPGRDRGVMAHGRITKAIRYETGMFAHDGENAHSSNPRKVSGRRTLAGRIVAQPARSLDSIFEDLQVGVGYTTSEIPEGVSALRGRTPLGDAFFEPDYYVRGRRQRAGVEARWRSGPFAVQSEYVRVTTDRLQQGMAGDDLPALEASAWYASGTWIVTGERKKKGANDPRRPLFNGGIGAVELAARIETLGFASHGDDEPSTSPRAATVTPYRDRIATIGVNWFPNRWMKVQANIVRDAIAAPPTSLAAPSGTYWSRVLRVQFEL